MIDEPITGGRMDQAGGNAFTDLDLAILGEVESSLANGLQLKAWWEHTDSTHSYADRFPTAWAFPRPDESFAFFDQAPLNGQMLPILGDVQRLFYDRPKSPRLTQAGASQWMRDQIREFVLRYFSHVSDSRTPQAAFEPGGPSPPPFLNPFGLCPERDVEKEGFGYVQLYYKLRESGHVGKFPEKERYNIVDMREIGSKYDWIVVNTNIFGFDVSLKPFRSAFPWVEIPFREQELGVISKDFIVNEENSEPGKLGTYGIGMATIKDPIYKSFPAYGPGYFDAGFETINFSVLNDGSVRVRLVFVANQPERIVNPDLDPATWAFKLADILTFGLSSRALAPAKNALGQLPLPVKSVVIDPVFRSIFLANLTTGGLTGRDFCISREDVEKLFLLYHFMANYRMILNSLFTWRQISDWLDTAAIPHWIVKGDKS